MSQNPFTFGNPIKESSLFFGRQQEIRQIVNRLLSSAHESTSISGEGRMGSTSLLLYLQNPDVAKHLGLVPESFCLVYVDFQGTDLTPVRFWKRVLHAISRSLANLQLVEATLKLASLDDIDLFDLEDHFTNLKESGLTTVLLMDEFENITRNPNFPGDFFGGLRALAIHHGLALIPATRKELVELVSSKEIRGSPFFNIFANIVLMPFPADEAEKMVNVYLERGNLLFSLEDKKFILKMGGGHPYLLQVSGYHWFEARLQGLEGELLYGTVAENIYEQVEPHFRDMWTTVSDTDKSLMGNLLAGIPKGNPVEVFIPQAISSPVLLKSLLKRGLLIKNGEAVSFISPAFEQFLRNQVMATKQSAGNGTPSLAGRGSQASSLGYDVFISYSTLDHKTAEAIVTGLEERGIRCWMAPRDIQPGTSYGQAIITAINECKGMIVVFSSNSNASDQVMQA